MNNKRSKQFFKENAFVTCFSRFLRSNLLEQLWFKLEKIYSDVEICRRSYKIVFAFIQEYFEEVSQQDPVIDHKANRRRVTLQNKLISDGQKSQENIQGNGDSAKCFEANANYKCLFFE